MSKIKVKFDDLEEFADKIGKVDRECDEALEALNWHFTSLLSNFPGMLPDSIHALEYELRYSINEYKNKLDEAQRLIRLTAAEMEKDEQKMGNKVSEFLLELVGWNDAQRVFSEYDPVTGKKLSFGDRVLAGGFLALSLLPPAKAVGVGGKTLIKGVDAGIPALAKTPGVLKKIRNVLDPKKFHQAFRSVYDQVVNAPIALTKAWFDTIKKEIGEIRLPQIAQEAYAGIGATERTVKDAFSDAKDLLQGIKNTKLDELDVGEAGGATKDTSNAFQWTGKNFSQMGKNMSPNEMISNLEKSGWNKIVEPGGKKSGPATIFTDPSTGTKVRIHAEPGEGTPYFRVQNKGGGYLDNNGVFPSNATKQELRDKTHFYFEK
ncbi:pre-toxin TG domain-containing protein [Caldifermentibacillus hisashii]